MIINVLLQPIPFSSRGGVRDPHILRGKGGAFYMVLTDLYVPEDGEIYLPVKHGAELSQLYPEFSSHFASEIKPSGSQDFSAGSVSYQ
jgi:hypothetical protein